MKTINYKGKGEHLLKSGQKQLPIHSVVVTKGTFRYDPKCDNACKFYCTKGNTQYPECLK